MNDVQFYSHLTQELKKTQAQKAEKFLLNNCIQYDKDRREFDCLPLAGYNTRTYTLKRDENAQGGFTCNCQYSVMNRKKGLSDTACSHVLALHLYFSNRNRLNNWGPWKKQQE